MFTYGIYTLFHWSICLFLYPVPYSFDFCSFVVYSEARECNFSSSVFLSQDCFGYLRFCVSLFFKFLLGVLSLKINWCMYTSLLLGFQFCSIGLCVCLYMNSIFKITLALQYKIRKCDASSFILVGKKLFWLFRVCCDFIQILWLFFSISVKSAIEIFPGITLNL